MARNNARDHGRALPRDRREAGRRRDHRASAPSRVVRLPVFTSLRGLRPRVAARRPDRRADGLGGARARGARLRDDRRRLAGRRPLRRARRADPLRRVRQLAAPRRRADVGDRGAVGGGRRRPRRARARTTFVALTDRAGARRPGSSALVAGLLRLGFLASFISEPVLKGFIIGLALTIIIGQVPKLLRRRARARATSSSSSGTCSATSATRAGCTLARRRSRRWRRARAAARSRRSCPASLVAVLLGIVAVAALRPRRTTASRSSATSTAACRRSACRTSPPHGYLDLAAGGRRRDARRLRRGPRRGQDLRGPRTTTRSTPTASCSASAPPTSAPGLSSGMVVNGSLSKTAVNGSARRAARSCPAWSSPR